MCCLGCAAPFKHDDSLVYVARGRGFVCDDCAEDVVAVARLKPWFSQPIGGEFQGHTVQELKGVEGVTA
jgi:hypothetical protein